MLKRCKKTKVKG